MGGVESGTAWTSLQTVCCTDVANSGLGVTAGRRRSREEEEEAAVAVVVVVVVVE